jgi:hypothetical protein
MPQIYAIVNQLTNFEEVILMGMNKVIGFKVPDEFADLQSRLTERARQAGLQVWQLLDRWLKESEEPKGEDWQAWKKSVEERLNNLSAEIVNQVNSGNNSVMSGESATKLETVNQVNSFEERFLQKLKDVESSKVNKVNLARHSEPVTSTTVEPMGGEIAPVTSNDIMTFEGAYLELERDRHTLIWKLREALDWPRERFDAVLRQLRDAGRFNPTPGGETEKMSKEQLQSCFLDENGYKFHLLMRASAANSAPMPASMGEPEPEPAAPASEPMNETESDEGAPISSSATRKPRKKKTTEGTIIPSAEAFKTILDKAKASEESSVPAPRRRGRPPKAMKV